MQSRPTSSDTIWESRIQVFTGTCRIGILRFVAKEMLGWPEIKSDGCACGRLACGKDDSESADLVAGCFYAASKESAGVGAA